MAQIAADRPGVGRHRDRLQTHPRKGLQVSDEHLVVSHARACVIEIEGIGVLHQEFAPAHHAEARPNLIPELPLDVVEIERQVAIARDAVPKNLRHLLFIRRAVKQVAVLAVADAQHLRAIGVIAAALAPQIGGLDGRHQDFLRAGRVLLLPHDLLDLRQNALAERQPGIDAGAGLTHQTRTQHQTMRDDFRLGGRFAQSRREKLGLTHRRLPRACSLQSEPLRGED